ncbi:MAG: hypothetical protein AAFQ09_03245 [Pseudomonadota bacterium]
MTIAQRLGDDGFAIVPFDPEVARWSEAALHVAVQIIERGTGRRHGGTWFAGVDALPNSKDGSIAGVPFGGAWLETVPQPVHWHKAQLSAVFPGYPRQDIDESDAAHRFRRDRDAAHVDGLLPEGPQKRRHLREPHAFIAGLPLTTVAASPLVVWKGSHHVMGAAFRKAFAGISPNRWPDVDVTKIYQAARTSVFNDCPRVKVQATPGEVILLHRHLVHGVAPWGNSTETDARIVAYFRPLMSFRDWL